MEKTRGTWSVTREGRNAVCVVFRGHIFSEDGAASAQRCFSMFGSDSLHIIVNAPDFEGYDAQGRQAWQSTMWPIRRQIKSITLLNRKPLIRMGVTAFGLFVGIPVVTVDTPEKLQVVVDQIARTGQQR